ncbi:MAG: hypothetical protein A2068_03110 [Ignavibacteria bacterium GWB2_35_6b]|nr:MAG: hypothetical protein A2068_03110 [Ignavibacteria bacterium GWB2_35_6b]
MKNLIYLLTAVLLAFNFSCKDSGTGPEEKKSVRDYTWTADTLTRAGSIQTLMRSIWGSSANNIYICGHNDDAYGKIWHYDGKEWEYIDSTQNIRQQFGGANYQAVHGTAANNVWTVGYSGTIYQGQEYSIPFILEYNGTNWKKHQVNTRSAVYSVHAASPNEVWACGADGIVYHYDGSGWDIDTIKIPLENNSNFQLKSIVVHNSTEYLLGIKVIDNGLKLIDYFYKRDVDTWSVIDSFITDSQNLTAKWGALKLYSSSLGKLYSYGIGGIFEWNGNEWIHEYSISGSIEGMYETNNENKLGGGSRGRVHHKYAQGWKQLDNFYNDDIEYTGVWMDEDEAFIMGLDFRDYPQRTIVLHGK